TDMGFDVAAGLILLYAAYQGYRRGFAQQTLQLVGLVVGVMYGEALGGKLPPLADPHLTVVPEPLRPTLLFVAAVFVIWLAITMPGSIYLMWYRKKVFGENTPSLGDRLFGAGLGVAKGALAAAVLLHLMQQVPPETVGRGRILSVNGTGPAQGRRGRRQRPARHRKRLPQGIRRRKIRTGGRCPGVAVELHFTFEGTPR
ncbi:MAG: CvpA family protein, partial [Planctomycetia bacterium]